MPHVPDVATRQPIVRLESDAALARAAQTWSTAPALALDTEFVRERTFFPRLGLVQISDGRAAYLLDPLAVRDTSPLVSVLCAPAILKVAHSASEDVEVLFRALGRVPAPLFDTQVAAGLAGAGPSLGYQRLVAELLGVELPKGETRTDWLARPLSAAQLAYAAEDVAFLLPLHARLARDLTALGRLGWAEEDSAALLNTSRLDPAPELAYLRVKAAGRLDRRQLAVLRELAGWRDREARRRNVPRGFVLRDEVLLNLSTRPPASAAELEQVPGFLQGGGQGPAGSSGPAASGTAGGAVPARDAAAVLAAIRQALELPEDQLPASPWRLPATAAARRLDERLRELVRDTAARFSLPPELLASRRTLDTLLRAASEPAATAAGERAERATLPRELRGWRRAVIGERLLDEVSAAAAVGHLGGGE